MANIGRQNYQIEVIPLPIEEPAPMSTPAPAEPAPVEPAKEPVPA